MAIGNLKARVVVWKYLTNPLQNRSGNESAIHMNDTNHSESKAGVLRVGQNLANLELRLRDREKLFLSVFDRCFSFKCVATQIILGV